MRVKVILNRIEKLKGFVYRSVKWSEDRSGLVAAIEPRRGSQPICSGCGKSRPAYDRLKTRLFQYVPLWGLAVYFLYAPRRVDCPACGVTVERLPWAEGKSHSTRSLLLFLAHWARKLSWQETADAFGSSWNRVCEAVRWVVAWGLENRDLRGVSAIGVDEIQCRKGQQYLTLVYQIDEGGRRLLYIGRERTAKTLLRFFHDMGREWCAGIRFVCSDMWAPYLKVIAKKLTRAVHVLDRFHIVAKLGEAVDKVRKEEAEELRRAGYGEALKHAKYCFLKNPENLTEKQATRLGELMRYDLKSVRAYLLKESFQCVWAYTKAGWAKSFLAAWCGAAMRSRLEPVKKFVGTVRRHEELILNWFRAGKAYSSGVVEGLNRKVNLVTRRAYGYRSQETLEIALFHTLGDLPTPPFTHRFW